MKINIDHGRNANRGSLVLDSAWNNTRRSNPERDASIADYEAANNGQSEWLARKLNRAFITGEALNVTAMGEDSFTVELGAHTVHRPDREWHYRYRPECLYGDPEVIVREARVVSMSSAGMVESFYYASWRSEWRTEEVPAQTVTVPYKPMQRAITGSGEFIGECLTDEEFDAMERNRAAEEVAAIARWNAEFEGAEPRTPQPKSTHGTSTGNARLIIGPTT